MPAALRQRLVPVLDPGEGPTRKMLPRARDLLRTRVAAIAVRVTDPAVDVGAAAAIGSTTVVMDMPERRFEKPAEMVARFRGAARDAGLTPIVFGAGDAASSLPGGIARSNVAVS